MRKSESGDRRVVGPYRLAAVLGEDAAGAIHLAYAADGGTVAVRTINPALAKEAALRGNLERFLTAAQRVPGTFVELPESAEIGDASAWVASRRAPGRSLSEVVRKFGALPARSVMLLGRALAEGLTALHAEGMVLGHVEPRTVHLTGDGPLLVDVVVAAAVGASGLTAGLPPAYAAPEYRAGKRPGPAVDVYSLGAVLLFAATGKGVIRRNTVKGYEPPGLDGLPEELRAVVARCLSADPASRPTPQEIRADLACDDRTTTADAFAAMPWVPFALALRSHVCAEPPQRRMTRRAVLSAAAVTVAGAGAYGVWRLFAYKPDPPEEMLPWPTVVRADFVQVHQPLADMLPPGRIVPGTDGVLSGPHFGLRLVSVLIASRIDDLMTVSYVDPYRSAVPLRAAPGHELLVASFEGTGSRSWTDAHTLDTPVEIRLSAGGREHAIDTFRFGGYRYGSSNVMEGSVVVAVSVPVGAGVSLAVTDEGVTQSLDLRAGRRGADAVPGFHNGLSTLWFPLGDVEDYDATRQAYGEGLSRPLRLRAELSKGGVLVAPWLPGLGWADGGRAWLVVTFETVVQLAGIVTSTSDISRAEHRRLTNAFGLGGKWGSRGFSLETEGGHVSAVGNPGDVWWWSPEGEVTVAFDVPADWRAGTFVFRPRPEMRTPLGTPVTYDREYPEVRIPLTRPDDRAKPRM